MWLLVIIAFFSLSFAFNRISGLYWWVRLAEVVLLATSISIIRPPQRLVAMSIVAAGVIQSIIAYTQFVMQEVVGSKWLGMASQLPEHLGVQVIQTDLGRVLRAYGSLPHPNILGGILVIAILAAVFLYLQETKWTRRPLWALSIALMSSGLWMTLSRQAWIALTISLTILILHGFIKTKSFPLKMSNAALLVTIPFIIFSLSFPDLLTTRLSTTTRLEDKSISERQDYIKESSNILQDHWIEGIGIGNYTAQRHADDQTQDIEQESYAYQPVHNIYMLVFTELGIFGFLTFLLFLISLYAQRTWNSEWSVLWSLSIGSLLIIGLFDHYLWSLPVGMFLFWSISGLWIAEKTP